MAEIEESTMTSATGVLLTPEGFERLTKELQHLMHVKRAEIADRIRESKEHGEFSEDNNELDEIKFEQAIIENRIGELRSLFSSAQMISMEALGTDEVGIGNLVEVQDPERSISFEVRLVSSIEADPDQDWVSVESPMGQALYGAKAGEVVTFDAPAGRISYKVLSISK